MHPDERRLWVGLLMLFAQELPNDILLAFCRRVCAIGDAYLTGFAKVIAERDRLVGPLPDDVRLPDTAVRIPDEELLN